MSRRTRSLVVVGIAVTLAALASVGVYRAIQNIPVREVSVASIHTVVATRPLPLGARVTSADVKLVAWPASAPVPGSFTEVDQVTDRGVISSVLANEPLTETKLAPIEAGAGLPPTIPLGMRAISVKVNDVIGVAGFVLPGTRVDVVVTARRAQDSMSRVVVTNVEVVAAGTRYDQEEAKEGEPVRASVVTLLVTPSDAERIVLAAEEGSIALALRNPLDVEPTQTSGVRMGSLMGSPEPAPAPRVVAGRRVVETPPPPKPYTVEAIRAAKRTQETVD
jgi:pilus assembly protein CpaB